MADFQPIDSAIFKEPLVRPEFRYAFDPELQRAPRKFLRELADDAGGHDRRYSWGFVIFRTVHTPDSDEAFAMALKRLDIYARYLIDDTRIKRSRIYPPLDPKPVEELWNRYFNDVVEDPETLAGVGAEEVRGRFGAWIREHVRPETRRRDLNARFHICLMLDQESIDNLLAMPEDPHDPAPRDPSFYDRWVKVVTYNKDQEPGGDRWWQLRIGIDGLWGTWFGWPDPDFIPECMGQVNEADGVLDMWGQPEHLRGMA